MVRLPCDSEKKKFRNLVTIIFFLGRLVPQLRSLGGPRHFLEKSFFEIFFRHFFFYLPACLPTTYLPAYLLPTYLPTCLPTTYLPTYLLPTYLLPTYLPAYLPTCLPTYLPTTMPPRLSNRLLVSKPLLVHVLYQY